MSEYICLEHKCSACDLCVQDLIKAEKELSALQAEVSKLKAENEKLVHLLATERDRFGKREIELMKALSEKGQGE